MRLGGSFCATIILVMCVSVRPAAAQEAQIPRSNAESVRRTLSYTAGQLLAVAEAMPESKYSFVPANGNFSGVRSFGEQIKHVACAQFAFFNQIEGVTPPMHCEKGGPVKAQSKAELIKYLRDSFEYGDRLLATINGNDGLRRVDGPYAGPNTRLGMAVAAVWHIADHYGQLVVYLRLNGIVPPATKQFPLNVR